VDLTGSSPSKTTEPESASPLSVSFPGTEVFRWFNYFVCHVSGFCHFRWRCYFCKYLTIFPLLTNISYVETHSTVERITAMLFLFSWVFTSQGHIHLFLKCFLLYVFGQCLYIWIQVSHWNEHLSRYTGVESVKCGYSVCLILFLHFILCFSQNGLYRLNEYIMSSTPHQ
jgi:hypothetical protein